MPLQRNTLPAVHRRLCTQIRTRPTLLETCHLAPLFPGDVRLQRLNHVRAYVHKARVHERVRVCGRPRAGSVAARLALESAEGGGMGRVGAGSGGAGVGEAAGEDGGGFV